MKTLTKMLTAGILGIAAMGVGAEGPNVNAIGTPKGALCYSEGGEALYSASSCVERSKDLREADKAKRRDEREKEAEKREYENAAKKATK